MNTELIKPVDGLLRSWEDLNLVANYLVRSHDKLRKPLPYRMEGPVKYWHELRSYLLYSHGSKDFDTERFVSKQKLPMSGVLATLPYVLYKWMRESRRVFHLSDDLQNLLSAISLNNVEWQDILFPFDTFLVTFDEPISIKTKEFEITFSCVFVCAMKKGELDGLNGKNYLQFRIIDQRQGYLIPGRIKKSVKQALDNDNWERASTLMEREYRKITRKGKSGDSVFTLEVDNLRNKKVSASVRLLLESQWGHKIEDHNNREEGFEFVEEDIQVWDRVIKIALGLCLYLKTLPTKTSHKTQWTQIIKKGLIDKKAITREAQVCTVTSMHKLSADEQEAVNSINKRKGSGFEKCAHYRRGHWRRSPNSKTDAPKCIMVRPTLVRADRLPKGAVPGGAKTIV
ncbi:hypothetical protein ISS03_04270 [Patescibacteria group bacterium]|nr:hypothetical protein [Patescibacteria group bacterium]